MTGDKDLSLSEAIRRTRPYHRLFQAALAILANFYRGIDVCKESFVPRPVFKFQGGVLVGNSEVVPFLNGNGIGAKALREPKYSADTTAVVKACNDLLTLVDWTGPLDPVKERVSQFVHQRSGMTLEDLESKVSRFTDNPFGDPLRLLFDLGPSPPLNRQPFSRISRSTGTSLLLASSL